MKKPIKRGFVLFGTALALCLAALGWAEIKEGKGKVGGEVVCASAAAKLSLAPIFSDNMVLQRGREVKVFGYGESGTEVTVKFGGQEKRCRVEDGKWSVCLDKMDAAAEGKTLSAKTTNDEIQIDNVLVGEVWLCSGQSNMELPLQYVKYDGYREYENVDKIRVVDIANGTSAAAEMQFAEKAVWKTPAKIEDLATYSAYAAGFALKLQEGLGDVPVGIVESDTSGSAIEEWMNEASVKKTGSVAESMGKAATERYNQMIYPMLSYTFGGFLWYQGEANSAWPELYAEQFKALTAQYRTEFNDMPVIAAQLPKYSDSRWPAFRRMQWELMEEIEELYVVCGIDLGLKSDIHPVDKYEFSKRAGELALTKIYGKAGYRGLSPYPSEAVNDSGVVTLSFSDLNGEIVNRGEAIVGFELCGADSLYHAASAQIVGNKIVVSSGKVSAPVRIRYAYAAVPDVSLYSSDNLPFAPFEMAVKNEYVLVSVQTGGGGRVKGTFGSVIKNSQCVYEIVCDRGYKLDKVLINGAQTSVEENQIVFKAESDKKIEVFFSKIPVYGVNVSGGAGGKVFAGSREVEENGEIKIYIVPEKGYRIAEVKVNGEKQSAENYACVIEKVAADVTVEVRFEKAPGCSGSIDAGLGIALLLLAGAIMIKKSVNKQEEIR